MIGWIEGIDGIEEIYEIYEIERPTGPRGTVLSSDGRLVELDHASGSLEEHEPNHDWIQTYSGVAFPFLRPRREHIKLEDVAHALSNLCRFGGHTREFFSVAQHSVLVATILAEDRGWTWDSPIVRLGLLHDAAEAYLVDVPRPIKQYLAEYKVIEEGILRAIFRRFSLGELDWSGYHDEIKYADNVALVTEHRDLQGPGERPWSTEFLAYPARKDEINPLPPKAARAIFLEKCAEVGIR